MMCDVMYMYAGEEKVEGCHVRHFLLSGSTIISMIENPSEDGLNGDIVLIIRYVNG